MSSSVLESRESSSSEPRLNRRQAAKVRTRGKVMEAARGLFAERGYEAATIRDIARGAGMSTGAVFANFQDKAELFEAVLAEDIARIADAASGALTSGRDTAQRLLNGLSAAYHETYDQLPLVQAIAARSWFQPASAEQRTREALKPLTDAVEGVIREGVASGELQQDVDVKLLASLIWEAFVGNYRRAAYDQWSEAQLSEHLGLQIKAILAGALAR
ncbi:TetR family transcriptional regulator [Brevundimonas balnearis]|uniref:TetR family transcriptional regulator n=1 Tax=Brevundimonas balnearis TaxID=1572858 RepID=A0ABV6R3B9_9CAUL